MKESSFACTNKLKIAKWFLTIAVVFFVAKPFLGYTIDRSNPVAPVTILVKSFTKRKLEFAENSKYDIKTVQKKLADPVNQLFLLFSCLLSILFPLIFFGGINITNRFIRNIKLSLSPSPDTWLLNGQLII